MGNVVMNQYCMGFNLSHPTRCEYIWGIFFGLINNYICTKLKKYNTLLCTEHILAENLLLAMPIKP